MIRTVIALAALLFAAAFLYSGNGLQMTLLAVRADIENFSTPLIGAMMAAYYVGFIAGCRRTPHIIGTVGHIRTFVALASTASASALAHSLFVDVFFWAGLRAVSGFCFAGMAMVLESWLNERASNRNRGQILSIYRIVDLSALTAGNAMLAVANPAGFQLFALVSILVSLALVPVALTRASAPNPIRTARLDIPKLYALSPVAAAGAMMVGLANAAFWSVGPIFVQRNGYDSDMIAAFMTVFIMGAAAAQWPLGLLSDKIDRRIVIALTGAAAAGAGVALALLAGASQTALLTLGAVVGALMIPMFGLAAAHGNDLADPESAVATNGGLLLLHGLGSVIGALAGGAVMNLFGPPSLFFYISGVYGLLSIFCLYRITQRTGPTQKTPFTPVPKGAAPTVFEIAQEKDEDDEAQPDAKA